MPNDSTSVSLLSPTHSSASGGSLGQIADRQNNGSAKSTTPFDSVFKKTAHQSTAETSFTSTKTSSTTGLRANSDPMLNQNLGDAPKNDLQRLIMFVQGGELEELAEQAGESLKILSMDAESMEFEVLLPDGSISTVQVNAENVLLDEGQLNAMATQLNATSSELDSELLVDTLPTDTSLQVDQSSLVTAIKQPVQNGGLQIDLPEITLSDEGRADGANSDLQTLQNLVQVAGHQRKPMVAEDGQSQQSADTLATGLIDTAPVIPVVVPPEHAKEVLFSAPLSVNKGPGKGGLNLSDGKPAAFAIGAAQASNLDGSDLGSSQTIVLSSESTTREVLSAPQLMQRFLQMSASQTVQMSADVEPPSLTEGQASLPSPSLFTAELRHLPGRVQVPVEMQFSNPRWSAAVAEKAALLVSQNISRADLQLDPPELGPLQVRIQVHHDQAVVNFVSANPQVREALDMSMVRLRELLQDQGLQLLDSSVSDHGQGQHSRDQQESEGRSAGLNPVQGELSEDPKMSVQLAVTSGIDQFV